MVADNGAQMDHGKNFPLRGGKVLTLSVLSVGFADFVCISDDDVSQTVQHTFWEGGVRVVCWISSPLIPAARRGTVYTGMAHSSDWYMTLVEGVAGGTVESSGGMSGSFLCLITPMCSYLYGGLYGRMYERAHVIRYFPPLAPRSTAIGRGRGRPTASTSGRRCSPAVLITIGAVAHGYFV
jgi:hypothetical protein